MNRPPDLVVGKEEYGGLPNPGRPHLPPAPHWRFEAIAAVERPRDLQVTPSGGLVFILDRDTSDVWHLAADATHPVRVTTQRERAPAAPDAAWAAKPGARRSSPAAMPSRRFKRMSCSAVASCASRLRLAGSPFTISITLHNCGGRLISNVSSWSSRR